MEYEFSAEIWLWNMEKGAWHFVTLPEGISSDIKDLVSGEQRRGFGSVKVRVSLDGIGWKTSIFPSAKDKAYIMPIKKDVLKATELSVGKTADIKLYVILD